MVLCSLPMDVMAATDSVSEDSCIEEIVDEDCSEENETTESDFDETISELYSKSSELSSNDIKSIAEDMKNDFTLLNEKIEDDYKRDRIIESIISIQTLQEEYCENGSFSSEIRVCEIKSVNTDFL